MKKLMVLVLVLAMAQLSFAGLATLRVNDADVKSGYLPSDIITLEIVASFNEGGTIGVDTTGTITMDYLRAALPGFPETSVGTLSATDLHAAFNDMHSPGALINVNGIAASGIWGSVALGSNDAPAGAVLWTAEFHVPDLPASTIIEISTDNFAAMPSDFSDMALGTNVLAIHIVPEPMTLGLLGLGGLFLRRRSK
jgi:hypothetical protein